MIKALYDVINQQEDNYLLPFYWQHGDHTERIPQQIERIYQSGCRALCVEARPHKDFGGEGWWRDMEIIVSECKKREMKVWILDDDHFPTGHANGLIEAKYPHLRQWLIKEKHVDVRGPMCEASVLVPKQNAENELLRAYAYRRENTAGQLCCGEAVELSSHVHGDYLTWDIPEGVWRIFFLIKTRDGGRNGYIDMLNPASVNVLLEAVYEPHWEHFSDEFGKTIVGFFSDEPSFGNTYCDKTPALYNNYQCGIGIQGMSYPWSDEVKELMEVALGRDPMPLLHLMWYDDSRNELRAAVRRAYMDAITTLYSKYFCQRLGDWCQAHNVEYIGHVIEDMGAHTHTRYGTGHYFRALSGQHMSGIDIVLHQVMPGLSDYVHSGSLHTGSPNGPFFHYELAKLGASLAHLNPRMQKRAMCEVFGAYGWAEGVPFMKWLIDFLLVRGINYFVPHAFTSFYPDRDCPPHFDAEGHDPEFEGFSTLMKYTNRAAHLLFGGTHVANAALLYHAEGEWCSPTNTAMPCYLPAKELYDHHIDYDIVPMDYLRDAKVEDGKLLIADECFDCLIVPEAETLPNDFYDTLSILQEKGLKIRFVNFLPKNAPTAFKTVALEELAHFMREYGMYEISVPDGFEKLRIYHVKKDGQDLFMLFNEDPYKTADTIVQLPAHGAYLSLDLLGDGSYRAHSEDGSVAISLLAGQSCILVFDDASDLPVKRELIFSKRLSPVFTLSLADARDPWKYKEIGTFDHFFNVTAHNRYPDFSGKMRYDFSFCLESIPECLCLDLGIVGEVAELKINGTDVGVRICSPYAFDISSAAIIGENRVELTVSNTLVRQNQDSFSYFMQIPPSGLLGDIHLNHYK